MDANAHIGKIGFFNGKFGFIHREEEKIFFHKRSINVFYKPHRNDLVRFFIAKDAKKNDRQIAVKIIPIINEIICNRLEKQGELHIGKVDWYRDTYGVIEHIGNKIFFHNSNVIFSDHYIHGDEVCVFNVIKSKKRIDTYEAVNVIFLKMHYSMNTLPKKLFLL